MNASAQFSTNTRGRPAPGQSTTVFHVPPNTVDEYQSFVGTSTMPGQLGGDELPVRQPRRQRERHAQHLEPERADDLLPARAARPSSTTPSSPTTSRRLGRLRLHATLGYFFNNYGNLGQYGPGIYQTPIRGRPARRRRDLLGEYPLTPELSLLVEEGFMGNRNGKAPAGTTVAGEPEQQRRSDYPASYVHHLHAGLIRKRRADVQAQRALDRTTSPRTTARRPTASHVTTARSSACATTTTWSRATIDERYVPDGSISVYGIDATVSHPVWGQLASAPSTSPPRTPRP